MRLNLSVSAAGDAPRSRFLPARVTTEDFLRAINGMVVQDGVKERLRKLVHTSPSVTLAGILANIGRYVRRAEQQIAAEQAGEERKRQQYEQQQSNLQSWAALHDPMAGQLGSVPPGEPAVGGHDAGRGGGGDTGGLAESEGVDGGDCAGPRVE